MNETERPSPISSDIVSMTGETRAIRSRIWAAAGTIFVCLGAAALFIPIIPTTPFLLLAAACYARGSPRAYRWLMENQLFGPHLKNYYEGKGMNRAAKAVSSSMVAAGISVSILIVGPGPLLTIIMAAVAGAVIVHILTLPNPAH